MVRPANHSDRSTAYVGRNDFGDFMVQQQYSQFEFVALPIFDWVDLAVHHGDSGAASQKTAAAQGQADDTSTGAQQLDSHTGVDRKSVIGVGELVYVQNGHYALFGISSS